LCSPSASKGRHKACLYNALDARAAHRPRGQLCRRPDERVEPIGQAARGEAVEAEVAHLMLKLASGGSTCSRAAVSSSPSKAGMLRLSG